MGRPLLTNKYARGRSTAYARKYSYGPRGIGAPSRGGYGSSKTERKFSDIDTATYTVSTTGSFTLLHLPVTGADATQRVGRKTLAKQIYIRGRVGVEEATSLATPIAFPSSQARMILFVDLQPNGAAPTVAALLKEALPSSQLNLDNRDRFRVLKDKVYTFDPVLQVDTATQARAAWNRTAYTIKLFKKCNIETIFNATNGGSILDINSGAIYMFWIGSTASGTNTDIDAYVSTRVRYIDN